uniref:ornithine cyclodeaminase family domain n=1 Tax=Anaerococcus mediterraneensis TaxID=1870984 RepID=UPI00093173DE|nr:hypothetical protein [Anaerococcus mediterraneensis]
MDILDFKEPDFSLDQYKENPDISLGRVEKDGIAPKGFYLTSHMPTYYKVDGKYQIPAYSGQDCLAKLADGQIKIVEIRDIKAGDQIVLARTRDGSEGVLAYPQGFADGVASVGGGFVESSTRGSYKLLFDLMRDVKNKNGKICWVLGPAVVFDYDTRNALSSLAKAGFVQILLGGNAMATHDLEGGYLNTALGQDIYTQISEPDGHYNHLDTLNAIRKIGSIDEFIKAGHVKNGFIKTLYELGTEIVLSGSIRDDGPLPEVHADVYEALTETNKVLREADLIIGLATTLHSASTAENASSYKVDKDGKIRPVFFYSVDVTENAVRKIMAARENIAVRSFVTNVQDFVVNLERELVGGENE